VEEIERQMSVMDEVEATLAANLKWAFAGKLVPQNPADEPASVLLEGIRATRGDAQPNRQMALPGV
jgi:type I restriction enzyme S subunit